MSRMRNLWAVVLAASFVPGAVAAEGESYAGEVTASQLNLRAGPGDAYQPVVLVDRGTLLVVRGVHANVRDWLIVEVPQGYAAWVFGDLVTRNGDGTGTVKGDRVLVRPRASTKWHELAGRLDRGESVKILDEKRGEDGLWLQIVVPSRIPLFASAAFIRNAGPASLAVERAKGAETTPGADVAPAPPAPPPESPSDKRFILVEKDIRDKLAGAKQASDIEPLRRAISEFDRGDLSRPNRERRVRLLSEINETERRIHIDELKAKEWKVRSDLEAKLEEIQRNYQRRLREIADEHERRQRPIYLATGIVQWRPDLLGRTPAYRIEEGGKMRYFLISTEYDLSRFVGSRVGITGVKDSESGTGFETVVVRRIEILGDG